MKYLLLTLITLLLISCDPDPIKQPDKCKDVECSDWQECNQATGLCATKDGFCNNNGECSGVDAYCDETHTCKIIDKCKDM